MTSPTPIKTYAIHRSGTMWESKSETRDKSTNQVIYTTHKEHHGFHMPRFDILTPDSPDSPSSTNSNPKTKGMTEGTTEVTSKEIVGSEGDGGTILASCKLQPWSRGSLLHLGDPETDPPGKDKASWIKVECEGMTSSTFTFPFNGRSFAWVRTHDKELGASRMSGRDFKLVDRTAGEVMREKREEGSLLAVWRYQAGFSREGLLAEVEWYAEMEREVEVLSLAAMLGILQHIDTSRKAAMQGGMAGAIGGAVA